VTVWSSLFIFCVCVFFFLSLGCFVWGGCVGGFFGWGGGGGGGGWGGLSGGGFFFFFFFFVLFFFFFFFFFFFLFFFFFGCFILGWGGGGLGGWGGLGGFFWGLGSDSDAARRFLISRWSFCSPDGRLDASGLHQVSAGRLHSLPRA